MAAALGYRPDGTAARLCFDLQQPSYNTDALSRNPVEGLWANHKDLELANRPTTTLAESPTPPKRASNESARATAWSSGSWPTPACPWTHDPSTQLTKLNSVP
jgi:hypothetical protein